jgi:hypothetical protein
VVEQKLSQKFREDEYQSQEPLTYRVTLFTCADDVPPEYDGGQSIRFRRNTKLIKALKRHCTLTVDLRQLPSEAFKKMNGPLGLYRQGYITVGLTFGAGGIELKVLYKGTVLGSVDCDYF